jgi:hypothetical protein
MEILLSAAVAVKAAIRLTFFQFATRELTVYYALVRGGDAI